MHYVVQIHFEWTGHLLLIVLIADFNVFVSHYTSFQLYLFVSVILFTYRLCIRTHGRCVAEELCNC